MTGRDRLADADSQRVDHADEADEPQPRWFGRTLFDAQIFHRRTAGESQDSVASLGHLVRRLLQPRREVFPGGQIAHLEHPFRGALDEDIDTGVGRVVGGGELMLRLERNLVDLRVLAQRVLPLPPQLVRHRE